MMNVRYRLLVTVLGLVGVLSACSKVSQVEFSPGLKSRLATLPKDSVVLIVDPQGKSVLADSEGKLATPCTLPERVVKGESQAAKIDKSTCTGLQKGYYVEAINTPTLLMTFANPHGCLICVTSGGNIGTQEICRPVGCQTKGH